MTKMERVRSHMEKLDSRVGVAEIADDYSEDATLTMAGTTLTGREAIESSFETTYKMLGDRKFSDVEYTERADGSIEVSWSLGAVSGGDIFWFDDDGYFRDQKVWVGVKPDDWPD